MAVVVAVVVVAPGEAFGGAPFETAIDTCWPFFSCVPDPGI